MTPPTVLFSPRIDWQKGWRESLAWLTDIQTSDNDTECRVSLRSPTKPRRTISYAAKALKPAEAALIDNLAWSQQGTPIGMPVWKDAVLLGAAATIGATTITLDTTYGGTFFREFVPTGFVGLWTDPFTWEIQTVTGGSSSTITLTALTKNWPLGSVVFPVVVATLAPEMERRLASAVIGELAVVAECDALRDTAMAVAINPGAATWPPAVNPLYGSPQFYNTLAVFRDVKTDPTETSRRSVIREESLTGPFADVLPGAVPLLTHRVNLLLHRADYIGAVKGILREAVGRCYPFWTPTWKRDLVLTTPALSTDTTITVQWCGYTANLFPNPGRHYLAVMDPILHANPLHVTGSVDNGNGTETLTLGGAIGVGLPIATMLSFFVLVRLDSDTVVLDYKTPQIAHVALVMTEIPSETTFVPLAVPVV